MEFIEDHAGDVREIRVLLQHAGENALGDHLDERVPAHARVHPGPIADGLAHGFAQGVRHARRHRAGRDAARLEHQDLPSLEPRAREQGERDDGALARARRSVEQHARVAEQCSGKRGEGLADGQRRQCGEGGWSRRRHGGLQDTRGARPSNVRELEAAGRAPPVTLRTSGGGAC